VVAKAGGQVFAVAGEIGAAPLTEDARRNKKPRRCRVRPFFGTWL